MGCCIPLGLALACERHIGPLVRQVELEVLECPVRAIVDLDRPLLRYHVETQVPARLVNPSIREYNGCNALSLFHARRPTSQQLLQWLQELGYAPMGLRPLQCNGFNQKLQEDKVNLNAKMHDGAQWH